LTRSHEKGGVKMMGIHRRRKTSEKTDVYSKKSAKRKEHLRLALFKVLLFLGIVYMLFVSVVVYVFDSMIS
jgi:hypothetical protein